MTLAPLLTMRDAGRVLGVCEKTVRGYVDAGELAYIDLGRGLRRKRRMIHPDDLAAFIERQRRTDAPCRSTSPANRRSTTSISNTKVVVLPVRRRSKASEKPSGRSISRSGPRSARKWIEPNLPAQD